MPGDKFTALIEILQEMESAVLAFSGGVDSSLLLKALKISGIKALAVTAASETMPEHDLIHAKKMAAEAGMEHRIIKTDELNNKDFADNPPERCFFCKDELFVRIKEIAGKDGYQVILDGSNIDDISDWRPGRKAASKHNVRSPLVEAGLGKKEIRELSKELNLPSWDRPSSPCLASRFPYGEKITPSALNQVGEAEKFLRSIGFIEFRVRHHGDIARIELMGEDIKKVFEPERKEAIAEKFKSLGYKFATIDLEEFRSGRMNEGIEKNPGGKRAIS